MEGGDSMQVNIKFHKIVAIITIITTVITILSALYSYILPMYIINKFNFSIGDAASIGIIGGADGPTSIFVTGNHFTSATTIIFFIISIIGISYLLFTKKRVK